MTGSLAPPGTTIEPILHFLLFEEVFYPEEARGCGEGPSPAEMWGQVWVDGGTWLLLAASLVCLVVALVDRDSRRGANARFALASAMTAGAALAIGVVRLVIDTTLFTERASVAPLFLALALLFLSMRVPRRLRPGTFGDAPSN